MHFKLLVALVDDGKTDAVIKAARDAGATGVTVLNQVRGEGLEGAKGFWGLAINTQRDMVLTLVEEHLSRNILEKVAEAGNFDNGDGVVFQLDVEDMIGLEGHIRKLTDVVEEQI